MQKLKALYRYAGDDQIWLIKGGYLENGEEGFVFNDFAKEKAFSILPEEHTKISIENVKTLKFESELETSWESTSKEDYEFGFSIIQNEIEHKHINKAILSRKKVLDNQVDSIELFLSLCNNYKESHIFLTETPSGEIWIGATPETLLENEGDTFKTMSLAGTKEALGVDWTEKEYSEQRIVTNAIVGELFKFNINPVVSDLETVQAGAVYHLRNRISFDASYNAIEIAKALHPTPAISGNPKQQAISTIKIAENHNRDYYCGYGGVIKGGQIEKLFVNLRCASISGNQMCLFVGGGITSGSQLEKEWSECDRKAHSFLRFL